MFNNLPISFEIFFKQYNFLRLIHGSKISLYILNLKKVSYPLTREQIKLFKKNDYNVNLFISYLLFFLFSLREFVTGIFIFLIINISSIYNIFKFTYKKKTNSLLIIYAKTRYFLSIKFQII